MTALVIGYGNALRGDDAAGLHVADAVRRLALPGVAVMAVQQLTPELAVDLGGVDLVVFIDADVHAALVTVRPVLPETGPVRTTHHLRPGHVLAVAQALGEDLPRAVLVAVPARETALSTVLSPFTAALVGDAVDRVREACAIPARTGSDRAG